jgi:hypothetical protein
MIEIRNGRVEIFDRIEPNKSLKKYAAQQKVDSGDYTNGIVVNGNGRILQGTTSLMLTSNIGWTSISSDVPKRTWKERLVSLFKRPKRHASEAFVMFSGDAEVMGRMKIKKEAVEAAAAAAKANFQVALAEKIREEADARLMEDRMVIGGFDRRITEEQVVRFFDKCDGGPLSLTFLRNYVRPLPDHVVQKLKMAEDMSVFDDYVILHFDPLGEGERLTKREIERRRDPILFGLVAGSRALYFVADWTDDQCKLTLEKLVETLGVPMEDVTVKESI